MPYFYSDYLISSFGQTTATGLATMLQGGISHDKSRALANKPRTAAEMAKPFVRHIQSNQAAMIVDDRISEKPYTDENAIVCWHYDHAHQRTVKGINFLTALYHSQGVSLPVSFARVAKTEYYIDQKDSKEKRRSPISKNEHDRTLLEQAVKNQIPFRYVLNNVWYGFAENARFINLIRGKNFGISIKSNRQVALRSADEHQGRYVRVDMLGLEANVTTTVYLEGVDFPVPSLRKRRMRRWKNHRPQTVTSQTNYFFAALCAFIKLEMLKGTTQWNHFALKTKLYVNAPSGVFNFTGIAARSTRCVR